MTGRREIPQVRLIPVTTTEMREVAERLERRREDRREARRQQQARDYLANHESAGELAEQGQER
jgi:uncharacterized membrane-anchored protein YhcB (DUF1043 family)